MRVAPRKARPFVPGRMVVLDSPEARRDDHHGSAQPGPDEASRRECRHDPAARHAAGRPRDADRRLPAARRRRPGVPARVRRGRRAARPLLVPRRRPAAAAGGARRPGPHADAARDASRPMRPDLPVDVADAPDPLDAIRGVRAAPPGRCRSRGCRGSPAARSGPSPTTPSRCSSRSVPLPERDPIGVPTAAFIETDLVLVFDHLTHTLSAIASLHTEAPDLEGRYRIAEAAIFDALERTARPSAAEMNGAGAAGGAGGAARAARVPAAGRAPPRRSDRSRRALDATPTSTPSRSRRTRSPRARRSRSCWRAASPSTCPSIRRQGARSTGSGSIARSAASTRARTSSSCGRRRSRWSARRRSSCCRSKATSSRRTRSPARGRAARMPRRTPCSPSSSSATRRSAPST